MPLNPSGPISIGGATTGQSINLELGRAATATSSLNEAALRTLAGVPSGQISLSNFYGKSNAFSFTLTGTDVNLRNAALSAGWNGTTKVVATIGPGVVISSTSTGTPALTISGAFPGGVDLVNNGTIAGRGGAGGGGGSGTGPAPAGGSPGGSGSGGGTALNVSVPVSVNNIGTIAGGGGGGGGGGGAGIPVGRNNAAAGGAGGGGGRSSSTNSSGGPGGGASGASAFPGSAGGAGTFSAAGGGGPTNGPHVFGAFSLTGGAGGSGGAWGSSGSNGNSGAKVHPGGGAGGGGSGGGTGPCTVGGSNITYIATGTRLGPLN